MGFKLFIYIITLYTLRNRLNRNRFQFDTVRYTHPICKITRRNNSSFIRKHNNAYVWAVHVYGRANTPRLDRGIFLPKQMFSPDHKNMLILLPILTSSTFKRNWFGKRNISFVEFARTYTTVFVFFATITTSLQMLFFVSRYEEQIKATTNGRVPTITAWR